jgi:hypothetical protein
VLSQFFGHKILQGERRMIRQPMAREYRFNAKRISKVESAGIRHLQNLRSGVAAK